jgi:hypothetical protein
MTLVGHSLQFKHIPFMSGQEPRAEIQTDP